LSVDNFFWALRFNSVRSQVSFSSMALLSAIEFVLSVRQSGFLRLSGGSFVQCGRTVFAVAAAVHSFVSFFDGVSFSGRFGVAFNAQ